VIIADTKAHAAFYQEKFKIKKSKFIIMYVGGDDSIFKVRNTHKNKPIIVEYHGIFTRLSGAEVLIHAAKILEKCSDIKFWLIGSSRVYDYPQRLLTKLKPKNLLYYPEMSIEELSQKISRADISVGHLGITRKAANVISNKTFQAMAVKNSLILGNTSANREVFINYRSALFVNMGDPIDLAQKIKILSYNEKLRNKLAEGSYRLFLEKFTNKILVKKLIKDLVYWRPHQVKLRS
jgi:glycosyltransferase involved in cell wall biosynthesis